MSNNQTINNNDLTAVDYVEYKIYIAKVDYYHLNKKEQKKYIQELKNNLSKSINLLELDYIYNLNKIELNIYNSNEEFYMLMGKSNIDDSLFDEWFITKVFLDLSLNYKDVLISLNDKDGEYILIESSEYLMDWMTPTLTTNKCFVHEGKIKIIKKEVDLTTNSKILNKKGILRVLENIESSINDESINEKIKEKITKELKENNIVYKKALLPRFLAEILLKEPRLISCFVNEFYYRNIIAKKANNFSPQKMEMEVINVKFNKYLYMKMHYQNEPKLQSMFNEDYTHNSSREMALLGKKIIYPFDCDGKYGLLYSENTKTEYLKQINFKLNDEKSPYRNTSLLIEELLQENNKTYAELAAENIKIKETLNDEIFDISILEFDKKMENYRNDQLLDSTAKIPHFFDDTCKSDYDGINLTKNNNINEFDAQKVFDILTDFSTDNLHHDTSDNEIDEINQLYQNVMDMEFNLKTNNKTVEDLGQNIKMSKLSQDGPCGPATILLKNLNIDQ